MASSANQRTPFPFPVEIKFGDFPPVRLTNLENQTRASISASIRPSQLQSGLSPLSPQLHYSQTRKQPRILVSPSSSIFLQPSPPPTETTALIASGSYYKVPSNWCPDDRIRSRDFYLSRNGLLKKMIHQRILYRSNRTNKSNDGFQKLGIKMLGSPVDYWVTFPLYPPIGLEISDHLPGLKNVSLNEEEAISIVYATGPVKPTRYALNRLLGVGREPNYDGLPFTWVANSTGTKFLHRKMIKSNKIDDMIGFLECPICKEIWCISYLVPERFNMIDKYMGGIAKLVYDVGDKALQNKHYDCRCDGELNAVRPVISEDLNKINWMILFLGFGIGYCTVDQLKYYCNRRKLPMPIPDNKEKLLVTVFIDLRMQITRRIVRPC